MKPTPTSRRTKAGFTMIELLVVIVIIGILAAALFRLMGSANTKTAIAKTTAQVHAIAALLEEYKALYGNYPLVTAIYEDPNNDGDNQGSDANSSYYHLNFTFKIEDGGGCTQCKNKTGKDNMQFGLCSHFIPRATTIYGITHKSNMIDHYESRFRNPADDEVWERELGGKNVNNSMGRARATEQADPNLQQIYRSWRRMAKDKRVYENAGTTCHFCGTGHYSGGAEADAWGRGLLYRYDGGAGEIVSAGPDGQFGTSDDIVSAGAAVDEDEED